MTSQHRTRAGVAAALAVASLVATAPAGADPVPAQQSQPGARAAALAQEQYYMSHKPSVPALGHDFGTIDARTDATAPTPASSDDFEWGDAAIGAGLALLLVVLGGGAVLATRHLGREQTA
jgi:hypothetical protein